MPAFDKLSMLLLNQREGMINAYLHQVRFGIVGSINGNIRLLLTRGREYKNLRYLLLKAQRMVATKTELVVFRKAA